MSVLSPTSSPSSLSKKIPRPELELYERINTYEPTLNCRRVGATRAVFILNVTLIILQLSCSFEDIKQVSTSELSVKTFKKSSNGEQAATIDATRAFEKLSPFHNIVPDAYLDPVSFISDNELN